MLLTCFHIVLLQQCKVAQQLSVLVSALLDIVLLQSLAAGAASRILRALTDIPVCVQWELSRISRFVFFPFLHSENVTIIELY